MPNQQPHLSIIVPSYNNANRLAASLGALSAYCHGLPFSWELVLVDDCSSDPRAVQLLKDFAAAEPGVTLLVNESNRGKGFSVRRGCLAARGAYRVFTDVDLAYPPSEIGAILRALEEGTDVAIACRVHPDSTYIMNVGFLHYLYTRHVMSRIFNLMVRALLLRDVRDTQAGLKGFTGRAAETIFPRLTISGFGFDVECLFVAQRHHLRIVQAPITFRYDSEPSTLNFVRDGAIMIRDLVHIWIGGFRGRYD